MASPPRGAGGVGGGGGDVRITVRMLSGGARVYLLPEAAGQGAPVARLKALIKGDVGTCAEEQILVRALEASVRSARTVIPLGERAGRGASECWTRGERRDLRRFAAPARAAACWLACQRKKEEEAESKRCTSPRRQAGFKIRDHVCTSLCIDTQSRPPTCAQNMRSERRRSVTRRCWTPPAPPRATGDGNKDASAHHWAAVLALGGSHCRALSPKIGA